MKHEEAYERFCRSWPVGQVISTKDAFLAGWNASVEEYWSIPPQQPDQGVRHDADSIYAMYPRKVGRRAAITAIERAFLRLKSSQGGNSEATWRAMTEATQAYSAAVQSWPEDRKKFVPHPATWFNQDRFLDDRSEWQGESRQEGIRCR